MYSGSQATSSLMSGHASIPAAAPHRERKGAWIDSTSRHARGDCRGPSGPVASIRHHRHLYRQKQFRLPHRGCQQRIPVRNVTPNFSLLERNSTAVHNSHSRATSSDYDSSPASLPTSWHQRRPCNGPRLRSRPLLEKSSPKTRWWATKPPHAGEWYGACEWGWVYLGAGGHSVEREWYKVAINTDLDLL